jgi:hypothetical protein
MKVTKGAARQDPMDGKWWMEVCLGAGASAMLHAPLGSVLTLRGIDEADRPPTQTIAASGAAPPTWESASIIPPSATRVRELAADPVFQDWAIRVSGADYNKIPDSVNFTLAFILNACRAKLPTDFADEDVIDRLVTLELAFHQKQLTFTVGG